MEKKKIFNNNLPTSDLGNLLPLKLNKTLRAHNYLLIAYETYPSAADQFRL